jgi:transposase
MVTVMVWVDHIRAWHTAVVISAAEEPLGELRVRACAVQAERLLAWAQAWPQRAWAVEGAGGVGHLLAQQLLAAGERVLDVPPKLAARVRLLATGDTNKNDPNDARSAAVAALRSAGVREARRDDHAAVLKIWSKRYRTQVAGRLHAVLCELIPAVSPRRSPRARPRTSWDRSHRLGPWRRPAASSPPSSPRICAVEMQRSARPGRSSPSRSGRPAPA